MSENNTQQDLNEGFEVEMDDTNVITVPIDATMSNSNEAADAKAVGDALALKADKSELPASIKVNNQPADAQGLILINGTDIPVSEDDEETLGSAVTGLKGKTAADIPMSFDTGAKTIKEVVDENTQAIQNMEGATGDNIPMEAGSTVTVKSAIETLDRKAVKTVNRKEPDANGDVDLSVVPLAENLQSDKMESVEGSFIMRTTGGNASVSDGKAYPLHLFGTAEHTGHVAESLDMTVIPITRTEPDEPITATIDRDTFVAYVDESGTINLYYTTEWSADPTLYGITVTGTPVAGDQITVVYVKEVRGTITVADPERLVGTGWNLFDYNSGYARVVKYSTEYGYKVGGSYASLQFSATLTGERSSITPNENGLFNVNSDGYVFVNGGNNTDTYILATWSDWTEGPSSGYWEPYRESGIDLSAVMTTYFPNGLLAVGTTRDEIDLSAKRAISRIERMAYSEENREAAAATGRSYDFDQNYIYIVRDSSVISAITIDTTYNVSEHGLEWFTETTLPVITEILYGKNLRDKLERDVLTISAQTLTEEEKAQARTNIGAMSQADGDKKLVAPTTDGTNGQLLQTNGDGTTKWTTQGTPTDAQVGTAVNTWLTAHPEATTTVQDGAISRAKLNDDLKAKTDAVPELKSAITEQTRNLITGSIKNASLESNGSIYRPSQNKSLYYAPVTSGKTYRITTDESTLFYGYFTDIPTPSSVAVGGRKNSSTETITVDTTGYLLFQTGVNYQYPQIEEGTTASEYIPPITATDFVAREDIEALNSKTDKAFMPVGFDEIGVYDLNSIVTYGSIYHGTSMTACTNVPTGEDGTKAFMLNSFYNNSGRRYQEFWSYTTGKVYVRIYSSSWSSWKQLAYYSDLSDYFKASAFDTIGVYDLNSLTTAGYIYHGSSMTACTNVPAAEDGSEPFMLNNFYNGTNRWYQLYWSYYSGEVYVRNYKTDWSEWKKVAFSTDGNVKISKYSSSPVTYKIETGNYFTYFRNVVNADNNADLWDLVGVFYKDGTTVITTGTDIIGPILERNQPDFVGGLHGDEKTTSMVILCDGVEWDYSTAKTPEEIKIIMVSEIYRASDHQTHIYNRFVTLTITKGKIKVENNYVCLVNDSVIERATNGGLIAMQNTILQKVSMNNYYSSSAPTTAPDNASPANVSGTMFWEHGYINVTNIVGHEKSTYRGMLQTFTTENPIRNKIYLDVISSGITPVASGESILGIFEINLK